MATTQPEETELPQIVNLSQVSVENLEAELVRARQSAIYLLNAEEVELQMSAAATIQTGDLQVRDSVVLTVASQQATLRDSIVGGARAETLTLNGFAGVALANTMSIKDVDALVVAATDVQADYIRTGVLIGRNVNGNVTTMVDGRTALLAGLAGGAVAGLILLAGKLLFGRKK
ncbi:MAG: hypothetical protein NT121_00565 [Chloroflexi bacterium]|nr:hypothetical protein [Chloroflexota bacterium]